MIKLSKGTVVALTSNYGLAANIGALAILKKDYFDANDEFIDVEWIENSNGQQNGKYYLNDFIVIKDKSQTDILLLMNKMGY